MSSKKAKPAPAQVDLEEEQEEVVNALFDVIDTVESESDYAFIERIEKVMADGEFLSDSQWTKAQRLLIKYVKPPVTNPITK